MNTLTRILVVAISALLQSCAPAAGDDAATSRLFDRPQRVTIEGYNDHAMEPFLTRDGKFLLFNNSNDPSVNTNLLYAERAEDLTFKYKGELKGVNTAALEGVPTMDKHGTFYFVSPRSYDKTFSTIYRGMFADGAVTGIELVPGISRKTAGNVNFDVDVSPDGDTLYFVDSRFEQGVPETADLVIAERDGAKFQRTPNSAEILKNVNSATALEYAPCISADALTLLFTRVRAVIGGGNPAIYVSQRRKVAEPFGVPQRLVALDGFVEAPTFSPDERFLYYHRKDGAKHVIYLATKAPK